MQGNETSTSQMDPIAVLINGDPFLAILVAVAVLLALVAITGLLIRRARMRHDEADLSEAMQKDFIAAPAPPASMPVTAAAESWQDRLSSGLSRTRAALSATLSALFPAGAKLGDALLEQVHEALYRADLGVKTTDLLVEELRREFGGKQDAGWDSVRPFLVDRMKSIFATAPAADSVPEVHPKVILVVGVNGAGKTTTIGKLAAWYSSHGKKVLLGAGDTFRAAAIEQLEKWAERTGSDLVRQPAGSDPAAVAFDAVKAGKARGADVIIIDTAGRLHSKEDLMAELGKINRSIGKEMPGAPHETLLVIDATTGQNAVQQVRAFSEVVPLTGLVATKLDGTAKGGVLVGIAHQFKVPVRFIGIGEKTDDLRPFDAGAFVSAIV
ncbi:MAG: Signal recognition particle receptor FtsY [Pseudomonadota bacterium]